MPASTSNFEFLHDEFPALYAIGKEAEFLLHYDPAAALSKLRLFGEKLVDQVFALAVSSFPKTPRTSPPAPFWNGYAPPWQSRQSQQ